MLHGDGRFRRKSVTAVASRFHNGQTITLSVMLGVLTLYYTWRKAATTSAMRDSLTTAMICGSIYWLAGLCAQMFPGADGLDPEFGGPGFPQAKIFTAFLGCGILGWMSEQYGI